MLSLFMFIVIYVSSLKKSLKAICFILLAGLPISSQVLSLEQYYQSSVWRAFRYCQGNSLSHQSDEFKLSFLCGALTIYFTIVTFPMLC